MAEWEKYKQSLNQLFSVGKPIDTGARIKAAAIIYTFLKTEFNIEAILVGGLATEVYSEGDYRTRDIDMVSSGQAAYNALMQLGFSVSKGGMVAQLTYRNSGLFIEFPSSQLEDADYKRVASVRVTDEYYFRIIGLEDLMLDRLRGILYHGRTENQEALIKIFQRQGAVIDWDYLLQNITSSSELETLNYLFNISGLSKIGSLEFKVSASRAKRGISVLPNYIISKANAEQILNFLIDRKPQTENWYAVYVSMKSQLVLTENPVDGTFANLDDLYILFMDFEDEKLSKAELSTQIYEFLLRKFYIWLGIHIL